MKNGNNTSGYIVPSGRGGEYRTKSIVKARAYAVKMIQTHPEWGWWDIYGRETKNGKPYTTVVYYGPGIGYRWFHDNTKVGMYANGRLKGRR